MAESPMRCGYVAIIGRPNVGKSTLLNRIVEQKLSITSHKPQTTRHAIIGIHTTASAQAIYVDTPGLHKNSKQAMNRAMNRTASNSLAGVDLVLFLVEADHWEADDEFALSRIPKEIPTLLVVNKIDNLPDKTRLLPVLETLSKRAAFAAVVPISARTGDAVDRLTEEVERLLPVASAHFPADQITDRSERFLVAEIIREKIMRGLGQEVPYEATVEVEQFVSKLTIIHISAIIWVARKGQKGILIGKGGERLKSIGAKARQEIETLLQNKVFLQLWVKVKQGWSDDLRAIQSLGYTDKE